MKDTLLVQSVGVDGGHVQERKQTSLRVYPQRFWLALVFCCCA